MVVVPWTSQVSLKQGICVTHTPITTNGVTAAGINPFAPPVDSHLSTA